RSRTAVGRDPGRRGDGRFGAPHGRWERRGRWHVERSRFRGRAGALGLGLGSRRRGGRSPPHPVVRWWDRGRRSHGFGRELVHGGWLPVIVWVFRASTICQPPEIPLT